MLGPEGRNRDDGFPPWSVGTLLVWLVLFTVLTWAIFLTAAFVVTGLVLSLEIPLNHGEQRFLSKLATQAVVSLAALLLVTCALHSRGSSLKELWGQREAGKATLASGCVLGATCMVLGAVIRKVITGEYDVPPTFRIQIPWTTRLGFCLLVYGLLASTVEEVYFRGLVHRAFRRVYSGLTAVVLSSSVFTAAHIAYLGDPVGLTCVALTGVATALLLEYSGSLGAAALFHVAGNCTLYTLYYVIYLTPE